jgi:hypothetical protein
MRELDCVPPAESVPVVELLADADGILAHLRSLEDANVPEPTALFAAIDAVIGRIEAHQAAAQHLHAGPRTADCERSDRPLDWVARELSALTTDDPLMYGKIALLRSGLEEHFRREARLLGQDAVPGRARRP